MDEPRVIKKYPNRRLYDTGGSRYITLAEVKELVMRAEPFRVVDSTTEADITRNILLQIILEQESGGQPLFTSAMLERFIRLHSEPGHAALSSFLDNGLDLFLKQQRLFAEGVQGRPGVDPMDFWLAVGRQNLRLWADLEDLVVRSADPKAATRKAPKG